MIIKIQQSQQQRRAEPIPSRPTEAASGTAGTARHLALQLDDEVVARRVQQQMNDEATSQQMQEHLELEDEALARRIQVQVPLDTASDEELARQLQASDESGAFATRTLEHGPRNSTHERRGSRRDTTQSRVIATSECAICLESLQGQGHAIAKCAPCGHTYHEECLRRALSTCACCPLCRKPCDSRSGVRRVHL